MMLGMTCEDYIFKLTSGQLHEAGQLDLLRASQHRLTCRRCRAFTRNNEKLDHILAEYKDRLSTPEGDGMLGDPSQQERKE